MRLPGKDDKIHLFKVHFIGYPGKIGSALVLVALELIYLWLQLYRQLSIINVCRGYNLNHLNRSDIFQMNSKGKHFQILRTE